ncbi:MAG: Ig-like domain-containing protein, partial [Clostridia bacterium]|nr:Ig-like domain-containing protein [Clostridia bacterium]
LHYGKVNSSSFLSVLFIADAAERNVTVCKEQVLYQWDLTDYKTYWSVSGYATSPLNVAQNNSDVADFVIDENGSYMVPKADWVSFSTTGACNNVDLSDPENTKIVIDYETENTTAVIVKVDMTKGDGDNFQECYFKSQKGKGTIEFNVKDLSDNKFGGKGAVASGYISFQFMTTKGTNAAILWKSARVVKTVSDNAVYDNSKSKQTVKAYNLSTGTDKGADILSVNDTARPQYSADGITFNTTANWAGFTSINTQVDISDTTTRLVADIENPYNSTIVYKLVCDGISTRTSENIVKELPWQSADGIHEIYLNQVFTQEQLKAVSNGKIQIQFLIFDTEKNVKIKSLSIVRDMPELPETNEKFKSYKPVELQLPAGKEPVLPGFVSVTTESNREVDIAVTWTKPNDFNNSVPGFYQFKGTLDEQSLADNRVEYKQGTDAEIFASVTLITTYDRFELPVTNSANWSKTEADQYGNYEFTENGLTITPNSLLGYTNSDYVVKNVNMDVVKGISYSVTAGSGRWAIKVQNLTTGDPQIASPEINFTGEGFYDFSEQNWSGIADLRIALYAVGPNNSVTYHSAILEEKPVPKQSFTVDTTNNKGWIAGDKKAEISGSDDTLEYNFSEKGLQLTSKGAFCSMNYTVSMVDLDVVKGMLYYVEAPNARWEI